MTASVARRVVWLLLRRGLLEQDGAPLADPLQEEEPLLAACAQASVRHRIATGLRAGKHVMRLGDRIEIEDVELRSGSSVRAYKASACTREWLSGARIALGSSGSAGIFRDPRSPESGCSNSQMGGSRTGFDTPGAMERRTSSSSQRS